MGKSGAKILIFDDLVLKITDKSSDDRDAEPDTFGENGRFKDPKELYGSSYGVMLTCIACRNGHNLCMVTGAELVTTNRQFMEMRN